MILICILIPQVAFCPGKQDRTSASAALPIIGGAVGTLGISGLSMLFWADSIKAWFIALGGTLTSPDGIIALSSVGALLGSIVMFWAAYRAYKTLVVSDRAVQLEQEIQVFAT